jgi:acetyl-CoA acetyltransferase
MSEAWILDVVRTPRGKGRPDGGLHGSHPQAPWTSTTSHVSRYRWLVGRGGRCPAAGPAAAVPMKTMRDLKLDPQRVNVTGGGMSTATIFERL